MIADRPYKCDFKGCNKAYKQKAHLKTHKISHRDDPKPYKCNSSGCEYRTAIRSNLLKHELIHSGVKNYKCELCDSKFTHSQSLARHKLIHKKIKPHECDHEACDAKFTDPANLSRHKLIHTNERNYICEVEGCTAKFSRSYHLIIHMRCHTNERPFLCKVEGCDSSFKQSHQLSSHVSCYHTRDGMERKKKKEYRLQKFLQEHFNVEDQNRFEFRNGCVEDPDKFRAFVDFRIINITNYYVFVECDENQHVSYETRCETTRMLQVHENLLSQGVTVPVIFIRFNPDGPVFLDGVKTKILVKHREAMLKNFLDDLRDSKKVFENTVNIVYAFYDSQDNVPTLLSDPEFPEELKSICLIME